MSEKNISREIAILSIFTALSVVIDILRIDLPQPLDYISGTPLLILTFSVLLKPKRAFIICATGSVLGQLIVSLLKGEGIYLIAYLPGAFIARGIEALIVSVLCTRLVRKIKLEGAQRQKRELPIMVIGGVWEIVGYAIVGIPYFMYVWGYPFLMVLGWYLAVGIDLIFLAIAPVIIHAIRKYFKVDYLDRMLFKDSDEIVGKEKNTKE
ncbi:MAG: ECF transporter S component [Candidatus Hodarchaeota archaeon]